MDVQFLRNSTISCDSLFKTTNEFDEISSDNFDPLSMKLPSYIPSYNHQTHSSIFKKKPPTSSNRSLDQRHFKITFEKPNINLLGDQDNMMSGSTISDIYLKSSGILAQTMTRSKFSNVSMLEKHSEIDFLDIESQPYNTNSIYSENPLSEMNTISSILIRNNKESFDFPRKTFNIKRKTSKVSDKEFIYPTESTELSTKRSIHNSENEVDKILDYFDLKLHSEKSNLLMNDDTINSMIIDPRIPDNEQELYEILNDSNERSFEMPVFKKCEFSTPIVEEKAEFLTTISEEKSELDIYQLPSPKFVNGNNSDSLEIENIISKNSMIEENSNLYFSFAELLNNNNINMENNSNFKKNASFSKNLTENIKNKPQKGHFERPSLVNINNNNNRNSNMIEKSHDSNENSLENYGKRAEKNEKTDSFSQYFSQDKENSSFESFYESIVKKKHESTHLFNTSNQKKKILIERKENTNKIQENSYIKKIISSTNGKKNTCNNKENKKEGVMRNFKRKLVNKKEDIS